VVKYSSGEEQTPQSSPGQTIADERKMEESPQPPKSSQVHFEVEQMATTSETKLNENTRTSINEKDRNVGSDSPSKITLTQRPSKRASKESKSSDGERHKTILHDLKLKLKRSSRIFPHSRHRRILHATCSLTSNGSLCTDAERKHSVASESDGKVPHAVKSESTRERSLSCHTPRHIVWILVIILISIVSIIDRLQVSYSRR